MLLSSLILTPLIGTLIIFILNTEANDTKNENYLKLAALIITLFDLFISLII